MSRRTRAESEGAFSLFPFLAVLLCTMGTLALVFVLIAQKTSSEEVADAEEVATEDFDADAALGDVGEFGSIVDAAELADAMNGGLGATRKFETEKDDDADDAYEEALVKTGAATLEEVLEEKESVEWFLSELDDLRSQSDETFEEGRRRLANAEAGIAKLREEADLAQRRYDALMNEDDEEDAEELRRQLAALDQTLEDLQEEAAQLREKNANAKKSYAIVPYQGKKGTFRRPIYVECKESGVYVMPEGIRFDERDFLLAQYPGNPFDTALRAASQRILTTGGQKTRTGEAIEPYPLVVVRPSGARYFYPAIAALASWGELYGYEFVEEDQELAYPAPDPVLAKLAADQANAARARMQAQLAEALSIRNARMIEEERARRGARPGMGDDVPNSELQARLGANVRLGAANPLAGRDAHGGRPGDPRLARRGASGRPVAPPNAAPNPAFAGAPRSGIAQGGAPRNLAPVFAQGGVFTGAADASSGVSSGASGVPVAPGTDLAPSVAYVGRFAPNAANVVEKSSTTPSEGMESSENATSADVAAAGELAQGVTSGGGSQGNAIATTTAQGTNAGIAPGVQENANANLPAGSEIAGQGNAIATTTAQGTNPQIAPGVQENANANLPAGFEIAGQGNAIATTTAQGTNPQIAPGVQENANANLPTGFEIGGQGNAIAATTAQGTNAGIAPGVQENANLPTGFEIGGQGNAIAAANAPGMIAAPAQESAVANDVASTASMGYAPDLSAPTTTTPQLVENAAAVAQESAPVGATTPLYMQNFVATPNSNAANGADPTRNLADTLGNTTFGAGATGESGDGSLAQSGASASSNATPSTPGVPNVFDKTVSLDDPPEAQNPIRDDEKTPPEAFLVSRELTRTAQRGSERGIVVRCAKDRYVFPKQPGLRSSYAVAYQTEGKTRVERDAELADVVTVCVKSWGLAGRNMYWAPYMKVEVAPGGEQGFKELQEFCDAQGLTLVLATPQKSPNAAPKSP